MILAPWWTQRRFDHLRGPKEMGAVRGLDDAGQKRLGAELSAANVRVIDYHIDVAAYRHYLDRASYSSYPSYYGNGTKPNFVEKTLEHYLAATLLELNATDTFVDVGSGRSSPAASIYGRLYGCRSYRQDIILPAGESPSVIGGKPAAMALSDGLATKIALHCAFEHFERTDDVDFTHNLHRILQHGGAACIVPLCLADHYAIQSDLSLITSKPRWRLTFDSDACVHHAPGFGSRFARFYDVPHLLRRVASAPGCRFTILAIRNAKEVDADCYVRFAALFTNDAREGST